MNKKSLDVRPLMKKRALLLMAFIFFFVKGILWLLFVYYGIEVVGSFFK